MATSEGKTFPKATIIPVGHPSWELRMDKPIQVTKALTFENVEGLLNPDMFVVWKDWISQRERQNLGSVRFALVHRFFSTRDVGREEAESSDFAFKVFLCLRLVRPTKSNFDPIQIQFRGSENTEVEIFSLAHQHGVWPNVPDAESLNSITLKDIDGLKEIIVPFLNLAEKGPENVRRAVRHFNAGYQDVRDPTIQIVIWCMGIESLFSSSTAGIPNKNLFGLIDQTVGFKRDIYEESPLKELIGNQRIEVGSVIRDLFELRNRFVHGEWIPADWNTKPTRRNLTGENLNYAEVLRETASFVLRKGILHHLRENINASSQPEN
jgi:hypothetical protein